MHCFVCGTRFVRTAWECGTCRAPLPRESRLARYEAEETSAREVRTADVRAAAEREGVVTTGPARLRAGLGAPRGRA